MFHKKISNKVILLLGSNLGMRSANLEFAIAELKKSGIKIKGKSKHYESEAWGFEGESFINQVIITSTSLAPLQVLDLAQKIEKKAGRKHSKSANYESRILDIDILFFNEQIIDEDRLKVPHPKIHERRFTLEPLYEILPEYKHPVLLKTIAELKKNCPDKSPVTAIIQSITK